MNTLQILTDTLRSIEEEMGIRIRLAETVVGISSRK